VNYSNHNAKREHLGRGEGKLGPGAVGVCNGLRKPLQESHTRGGKEIPWDYGISSKTCALERFLRKPRDVR